MKIRNVKRGLIATLLLLAIVFSCVAASGVVRTSAQSTTEQSAAYLAEEKYVIANEKKPNGIVLGNYASTYYGKNASLVGGTPQKITIERSDDIIKIIPPELFKKVGKTFHLGKGYGFFVDCQKKYDSSDILLSTVIIIDIGYTNNMFDEESKSHLKIKLTPIFQGDFQYVKRGSEKVFKINKQGLNFFKNSYTKDLSIVYPNGEENEFIVPVPTEYIGTGLFELYELGFFQHNKYYFTNAVAMTSLYNVNQLNQYDADYVAENDTGSFFVQTDFNYKGRFLKSGEADLADVGTVSRTAAAYGFDLYDAVYGLKSIFKFFPIADKVISLVDFINTISKIGNDLKDTNVTEIKEIKYTPHYNSAQLQIEKGGLYKDSVIAVHSDSDKQLLIGTNDYVEFDYQVNCRDISVDTKFATMINLGIMSVYGVTTMATTFGEMFEMNSSFSNDLKNHIHENYTEVPEIDLSTGECETQVTALPYSESYRLVKPSMSGKYNFTIDGEYASFRIREASYIGEYINFENLNAPLYQSTTAEGTASIVGAELKAGKSYLIEIDLKNKVTIDGIKGRYGVLYLNSAFKPDVLQLGDNVQKYNNVSSKYYQFNSGENLNYKFTVDSPNSTVKVMDSDFNVIASSSSGQIVATMSQWGKYYIEVSFPTAITGDVTMHVADEMYVSLHNSYTGQAPQQVVISSCSQVNLPTPPPRTGYTFDGWWTAEAFGNKITDSNILEIKQPTLNLYARWKPIPYKITYIENGGVAIPDGEYNIEHTATLNTSITRDSYVFMGWYKNSDFSGGKVVAIPQGETGDKTFYARWIKDSYSVSLDVNASYTDDIPAQIAGTVATVAYGANYTLPTPTFDGFIFSGWWSGNTKYTDSDGHSIASYTNEQNITLVAKWSRAQFYIKVNFDGSYKWITKSGADFTFSNTQAFIENQVELCPSCLIRDQLANGGLIKDVIMEYLYKEGHIYIGLEDKGLNINCYKALGGVGAVYEAGSVIPLDVMHKPEKLLKLEFYLTKEVESIKRIQLSYDEIIIYPQALSKVGYTFSGWRVANTSWNRDVYAGTHFAPGNNFKYVRMPDLSIGSEEDGSIIDIEPIYLPNSYTVSFSGAPSAINTKTVVYATNYNTSSSNAFPVPIKTGHSFDGWYTATNGAGTKKTDGNGNYIIQRDGILEEDVVPGWDIASNTTLYAKFTANTYVVTLNIEGGIGGTKNVTATYGQAMPTVGKPTRLGYTFNGYYTGTNGTGTQYYNGNMQSVKNWTTVGGATLYAYWTITYHNVLVDNGHYTENATAIYGQHISIRGGSKYAPTLTGYDFMGYFSEENGKGVKYFSSKIEKTPSGNYEMMMDSVKTWDFDNNGVIYAHWVKWKMNYEVIVSPDDGTTLPSIWVELQHEGSVTLTAASDIESNGNKYKFEYWWQSGTKYTNMTQTFKTRLYRNKVIGEICLESGFFLAYKKSQECVATGTQITLADGRQVPVETLTGDEMLLVWNLKTGRFDTAPILFIDSDEAREYKIINLYFSDGTQVKVISEHAFWDFDLNEYVFLREDAAKYIGHSFNKQITDLKGQLSYTRVQLVNVVATLEYTTAWSPVTFSHLCYYVNGMLSMPGATTGLINIFTVDSDTMMYDSAAYIADISQYGLFTYEEFAEIFPIPEEMFNAFNVQYLKISIGKGLISYETLGELIERYVGLC